MGPQDLPLYLSMARLLKYLYQLVRSFPKEYKYSLGTMIIDLGWEVLDEIIFANQLPNEEKVCSICKASVAFDKLKVRTRFAHELGLANERQFGFLIKQNEEVGKMLFGWLSWANRFIGGGGRREISLPASKDIEFNWWVIN